MFPLLKKSNWCRTLDYSLWNRICHYFWHFIHWTLKRKNTSRLEEESLSRTKTEFPKSICTLKSLKPDSGLRCIYETGQNLNQPSTLPVTLIQVFLFPSVTTKLCPDFVQFRDFLAVKAAVEWFPVWKRFAERGQEKS